MMTEQEKKKFMKEIEKDQAFEKFIEELNEKVSGVILLLEKYGMEDIVVQIAPKEFALLEKMMTAKAMVVQVEKKPEDEPHGSH